VNRGGTFAAISTPPGNTGTGTSSTGKQPGNLFTLFEGPESFSFSSPSSIAPFVFGQSSANANVVEKPPISPSPSAFEAQYTKSTSPAKYVKTKPRIQQQKGDKRKERLNSDLDKDTERGKGGKRKNNNKETEENENESSEDYNADEAEEESTESHSESEDDSENSATPKEPGHREFKRYGQKNTAQGVKYASSPSAPATSLQSLAPVHLVVEFSRSRPIKINVGGKVFVTAIDTLTRENNSLLFDMFTGKKKLVTDDAGCFFIDRDPDLFKFILEYLRSGSVNVNTENRQELQKIKKEAEHFGLKSLVHGLNAKLSRKKDSS